MLFCFSAGFYFWLWRGLPALNSLPDHLNHPSVRITDRSGRLLYDILPQSGGRHTVIPLRQMPVALRQASIATEDANFYTNPGVDITGIIRSFWINLRGGSSLAGGSTITQQVARNLLMDAGERSQRSLQRKLRESLLALELTRQYPKDQILALYLNQTYYGEFSYGVEAAAQTFFGKPVNQLDLAECALLAGLPQSPAAYDPRSQLDTAKVRQKIVLGLMVKQKMITELQASQASEEPLVFSQTPFPIEAPHFVMWVRNQLDTLFSQEDIYAHGGLVVRTSLDLNLQHLAEQAITDQMKKLRQSHDNPLGYNLNNAALVALDPNNGQVLVMVGSPDYFDTTHAGAINMANTPRQPGSALKPLIYATAFDPNRVQPFTPATMLLDVSTHYVTHNGIAYTPVNYDGLEHGPVLVRTALASSLNIPAVQTLNSIGLPALFKTAQSLGITTFGDPDRYDLSLALGGGEVSLLELTGAYGALANGGYRVTPLPIQEVTDPQGNVLYQAPAMPVVKVLDQRVTWLINDILSDDEARILGFGRNSVLKIDRPTAVKTGTTTDFHDNWAIGFTPDLVVGVWAGNADHAAMRNITGLTGAAPVWAQFIRSALQGQPVEAFKQPDGIIEVEICALSGLLPTPACPYTRKEWFIDGTQPHQSDTIYKQVTIDQATGALANANTPTERQVTRLALVLPPSAQSWAHTHNVLLMSDLESQAQSSPATGQPESNLSSVPLVLTAPAPESIFKMAQGFDPAAQRLHLAAVGESGLSTVTFYVDGVLIAMVPTPPYETWWPLSEGVHEVWASTTRSNGEKVTSQTVKFTVK
ncbi:MAG TPA: transglycosylase domain-containing protein [Anaerolineaceae bacterium]